MKLLNSLRLFILIVVYFLKRSKKWILASLVLIFLISFAQLKFNFLSPNNILREGLVGTYQEHDLPQEVTRLVSQGLVEFDSSGKVQPLLVSGWETNNDATIFKFKLKDNLYWVDGSPIKSSDIEFNIPDVEISFPDDKTIQFKLKEAYSPFPSLLIKPIFKRNTFLGTGPYQVKRIDKSRVFITKVTLNSKDESLPNIEIRFYPNESVAMIGFNMGEVHTLLGVSGVNKTDNPQLKIQNKTDYQKIVTIIYNTKDPLLSNRSLRQALSFASPIIKGEEEANNPYPPSSWAYMSDSKKYLENREEAEEALERARSNLPEEKLSEEMVLTTTPNLEEVGQQIVAKWVELGFNVKLRIESGIPQNFQSLLITQSIPKDPDQYFLWHSTQEKTNLSKYSKACCPSSARVDKDLEDGRKSVSQEDRVKSYHDFQAALLEDAPAAFLYFPKYNVVYLKKVENLLDKVLPIQLL